MSFMLDITEDGRKNIKDKVYTEYLGSNSFYGHNAVHSPEDQSMTIRADDDMLTRAVFDGQVPSLL